MARVAADTRSSGTASTVGRIGRPDWPLILQLSSRQARVLSEENRRRLPIQRNGRNYSQAQDNPAVFLGRLARLRGRLEEIFRGRWRTVTHLLCEDVMRGLISIYKMLIIRESGAGGIRTLGTVLRPYNGLANHRLQPLGHSSIVLPPRRLLRRG